MNNHYDDISANLKKGVLSWIKALLIAFILAYLIRSILFSPYVIDGSSMYNTLLDSERVVVNKIAYDIQDYQYGDIIVFTYDNEHDYIKRVIGLSGDTVEVKNNQLYIDGEKVLEPYLTVETGDFGPILIPTGQLFVMGDNRHNSIDSREFGAINKEDVIGRVDLVFWPLNNIRILD